MPKVFMNNFSNGPLPHITVDGVSADVSVNGDSPVSPNNLGKQPFSYQRAVMESTISGLLYDLDFQSERVTFFRDENKQLKQDKVNLEGELEKLSKLYGLVAADKPDAEAAWKIIQKELMEVKTDYADLFERYVRVSEKYKRLKEQYA